MVSENSYINHLRPKKNWNNRAFIVFYLKKAKILCACLLGKKRLFSNFTRLDLMNKKALNMWHQSIHNHDFSKPIQQRESKIKLRHVSSKSFYLCVQFEASYKEDPIKYWYCQCKFSARLVGSSCAHVASVRM